MLGLTVYVLHASNYKSYKISAISYLNTDRLEYKL
jgi:hypothetical protein